LNFGEISQHCCEYTLKMLICSIENQLCCGIGPGRAHYNTTEWWLSLWDCGVPKSNLALHANRVF